MTIELRGPVEEQLRDLAVRQGRDISSLVEEALQEYLEAIAITDLDGVEVAETQISVATELHGIPAWEDPRAIVSSA